MTTPPTANHPHSVTLRFLAAPTDAGITGTVAAGTVLEWVDKAAYAAAVGWSANYCVTAYVGNIHFADPIHSGDLVEVTASVVYTRAQLHAYSYRGLLLGSARAQTRHLLHLPGDTS